MSSVTKEIADRIIAGEFAKENITCIIKYQSIIYDADVYKIIPARHDTPKYRDYLLTKCEALLSPEIYWEKQK